MMLIISILLIILSILIIIKAIKNTYEVEDLINSLKKKYLIVLIKLNIALAFVFIFGYTAFVILELLSKAINNLNNLETFEYLLTGILFLLSAIFIIVTSIVTVGVGKLLYKIDLLRKLDSLTGVYNHLEIKKLIAQEFSRSLRYQRKACLLMIDINAFKAVNDLYGHMAGDKVILDFVTTIKEASRSDDILGRIGGDEFIIIMPETDYNHVVKFVTRLDELINNRIVNYNNKIIKYSISAGISEFNSKVHFNYERWLADADINLYKNKYESHAGKFNCNQSS